MAWIPAVAEIGGSLLNYFLQKNQGDKSQDYLSQLQGMIQPTFSPYMSAGTQALPQLESQYTGLLQDPSGKLSQIGAGFQQSPGYQWNVDQATKAANQAAAAGGMAGSPAEQASLASTVHGLSDQDYQQYMRNALGLYGQGLAGEQGLAQMGLGAAGSYSDALSRALMAQAGLAYAQQANQGGLLGGTLGGIVGGLGSLFGKKG